MKAPQPKFRAKDGVMKCTYFDGCSAPLCPRDEGIAARAWFPDEDICRLSDVPGWVKRQRKVSRRAAPEGYFTMAMLNQDCRIAQGMKGIDPDGSAEERASCEAAWFKAHPVITAEERERNRALAAKSRAFLAGQETVKTAPEQGLDEVSGEKGAWIPPAADRA
jgi:hypothetical protein